MDRLVWTAVSGMSASMARQRMIASNMANAQTIGFRAEVMQASPTTLQGTNIEVRAMNSATVFGAQMDPGTMTQTGRPLDIAVNGEALITVQASDGTEAYTRRGDLTVSPNGMLVNGEGYPVMGEGGPISVPPGGDISIGENGAVLSRNKADADAQPQEIGRIKLASWRGTQINKGLDGLFRVVDGGVLPTDAEATVTRNRWNNPTSNPPKSSSRWSRRSAFTKCALLVSTAKELDEGGASLMRPAPKRRSKTCPLQPFHVARTGLEAQDARMRVIANNLANIGTTGFKRDWANFATLAYQDARVAGQQSSSESAYATGLNLGTGVNVQSTTSITTQGTLNPTDNPLDLALDGDGYFQVQLPGGKLGYTRAGNFTRSADGQLVTSQGYPVQPAITIPEGASSVTISSDGTVSAKVDGASEATELGQLTISTFANPAGLQALGDNFVAETAASGAAQAGIAGQNGRGNIRQGMLEASNVNVVTELVDMIECQRAYEVNSKMISAVDEMLRNANQTL